MHVFGIWPTKNMETNPYKPILKEHWSLKILILKSNYYEFDGRKENAKGLSQRSAAIVVTDTSSPCED